MKKAAVAIILILMATAICSCGSDSTKQEETTPAVVEEISVTEEETEATSIILADTSKIEVYKEDIEVDDDTVENYIRSILSSMADSETIEDGVVESGDTVNIDFVGTRIDTGEAFEGGSAEGYDLTIGSGSFIDGFEDGLIGKRTGDKVDLDLTFPENYSAEELAGQGVVFTVTINSIQRTVMPELTDKWVKEYSTQYCPEPYNTVAEFRGYAERTLADSYLHSAIYQYLEDHSEIKSYDAETEKMLIDYSNQSLEYYAQMNGVGTDAYASMMGYSSAEEYNKASAVQYLDIAMIVDAVCEQNNISYTDEELDAAIEQYMKDQKYIDSYTVEEFVEWSGDTWMWLFTNLQFKFDKAMDSLRDNVVVLEDKPLEDAPETEETLEKTEDSIDTGDANTYDSSKVGVDYDSINDYQPSSTDTALFLLDISKQLQEKYTDTELIYPDNSTIQGIDYEDGYTGLVYMAKRASDNHNYQVSIWVTVNSADDYVVHSFENFEGVFIDDGVVK